MRVIGIVQARMGSTRLPGKVLMEIGGVPCLTRVLAHLSRASQISEIVVATTLAPIDDAIVEVSKENGFHCFRGDERDVLSRYLGAAEAFNAEGIVRITSDCPLIDPGVVDRVIAEGIAAGADFASNDVPLTYPRGLDAEFFTRDALQKADRVACEPYHREHVTPVFHERKDLFRTHFVQAEADYSHYRWTLDTPEDLDLIRAIYAHFSNRDDFTWREVIALMESSPQLAFMNAHVAQKSVYEVEAIR